MSSPRNAKDEFLEFIGNKKVIAAEIEEESYDKGIKYILYPDYTEEELDNFLKQLDFNYDAGCGSQEIYGTIFFNDGSWAERQEYDGSEWWEHIITPSLPVRKEKIEI